MTQSAVTIDGVEFPRAFFRPGEPVVWSVRVRNEAMDALPVSVKARVVFMAQPLVELQRTLTLSMGIKSLEFVWHPTPEAPRGYGLDVTVSTSDGRTLAAHSTAFDVLEHWTQMPRYGFLSDFQPNRPNIEAVFRSIQTYRLNALQFYDWMYRHEQFLTEQEPYQDPLGRTLSRRTVDTMITAAHARGIAAMPYTAIYAASMAFYHQHVDWALYRSNGQPYLLGENFLVYMDPRPSSPWSQHLLAQFDEILTQTDFDGIHLDQYGDPKDAYDVQGNHFNLAEPLAALINLTREHVRRLRPEGAVVFNAVGNWPIETVAAAGQDIVYIEVWPPYTSFQDLHHLIVQAQHLSGGKAVVLAAYIDPRYEVNARLMDAIILASGGSHIEFGEEEGYLADPYFPNYKTLSPSLGETLRRYQEFAIRYQNFFGPTTREATTDYAPRIILPGLETSPSLQWNKVYPLVRESDSFTAINLINLVGLSTGEWNQPITQIPTTIIGQPVVLEKVPRAVRQVWWASPDFPNFVLSPLPFTLAEGELRFQIPALHYWGLILIEWSQ
ncbi:glycoside hydrolase family 66 protein [Thermanaerothrix sp. 4228-RoL]|uniref:Glycoside hydrolase family 66 protein n=1 Tax=Thermanaerothrix solaris TaxID=3058434 RepID=A0ABU3NMN9_9CHLR|nr:glycoside hydrolase family 66 protein [Thermanaerothrix sp. 4228-RoL]MDT8898115.1 glycoside hydrolase family 66 protein [Thermanaerothrix sp. 4228-RoL]